MLSIVIPAFNEEKRLGLCLEKTISFVSKQLYETEIIVVCDGCTDNTASLSASYKEKHDSLRVIEYAQNRGKGYAVKRGIFEAAGDIILFMDADHSVPIETVNSFIKQVENGCDIVIGARNLPESIIIQHQMFFRELAGKAFGKLQKAVLKIPYYDTQCGFKLFTRQAAYALFNKIKFDCSYFDAEVIYLAHSSGMKIKEMPVTWKHDGFTTMPIGLKRTIDLLRKLFSIKKMHNKESL